MPDLRETVVPVIDASQTSIHTILRKNVILVKPHDYERKRMKVDEDVEEQSIKEEAEIESSRDAHQSSFDCDSCEESFDNRSSLIIHKTERSIMRTREALREPELKYECDLCKRLFARKGSLVRHYQTCSFSNEREERPPIRRRGCNRKPAEHGASGTTLTEEPVSCEQCGKVFKKLKYLRAHQMLAHAEEHACLICDERFDASGKLRQHMAERHSGDYSEFCEICHKGFHSRQSVKVHVASHARDSRSWNCELCDKRFRHEVYLRKHVQLVHVERMGRKTAFTCETCGYSTTNKNSFREHMYKHTGEDVVECDVCGKRMRKAHLRIHSRIHTGEKPEICEYCGKSFSARKYLTKHRVTHTGEKPYQCKFCGRRYTQRGTLTSHFRKHHPAEAESGKSPITGKKKGEEVDVDVNVDVHTYASLVVEMDGENGQGKDSDANGDKTTSDTVTDEIDDQLEANFEIVEEDLDDKTFHVTNEEITESS